MATNDADSRWWDNKAAKYSQSPISDQAAYQRTLDKTVTLLKSDHAVVELGCGTGSTALHLAPHARSYLGTDYSTGMIEIANGKLSTEGKESLSGLSFRAATAEDLVSAPDRYDVVLGFNYLHLMRDMAGTLKSVNALLVPGGLFISKTPCIKEMPCGVLLMPAVSVGRAVGLSPFLAGFTAAQLREQVEEAGFEILEMEYHGSGKGDARPYIVAKKMASGVV